MTNNNNLMSYVNALFDLSNKNIKIIDELYSCLLSLKQINLKNKIFFNFMKSYFIAKQEKKELISLLAKKLSFPLFLTYWIYVIIDNNDYQYFLHIFNLFEKEYFQITNTKLVKVYTPFNLTEQQTNKIKLNIIKKLGCNVKIEEIIKKSLINGIEIKIDDKLYQNSFQAKLNLLKKQMLESINNE